MEDRLMRFQTDMLRYAFEDQGLLRTALTHTSVREMHDTPEDHERLELLGDAVIYLLATERFYHGENADVDEIHNEREKFKDNEKLIGYGRHLGLGDMSLYTLGGSIRDLDESKNIVANTLEAIIGAIYIDGGLERAREFFDGPLNEAYLASDRSDMGS